ncbi:MAG: hypothetical protein LBQ66_06620 [Planctomycetaceae bacterium]|nr:hypothetical protein [Planctomycetaceae bacterium]
MPARSLSDHGRHFPCGVRVGRTSYGFGVFAYAFIPQGTPIAKVPGKIIVDPDYSSEYCIGAGEGKVLEPAPPFCYLNHSCEPNCLLTQYVRDGEETDGEALDVGNLATEDIRSSADDEDDEYEDESDLCSCSDGVELSDEYDDECYFGDGSASDGNAAEFSDADADDDEDKIDETDDGADEIGYEPEFDDDVDAEIWVETLRDILPGEQLTIDYAWPADKAAKCQCGSPKCRGWIVAADEIDLLPKRK